MAESSLTASGLEAGRSGPLPILISRVAMHPWGDQGAAAEMPFGAAQAKPNSSARQTPARDVNAAVRAA